MPDTELFNYRITITGRIHGHDRSDAEARLKAGINMTLPIHESIDGLVILTEPDGPTMDELRGRFK